MTAKEFPPSAKRLERARKEGKAAKSRLLTLAVSWWTFLGAVSVTFTWLQRVALVDWKGSTAMTPEGAFAAALGRSAAVVAVIIGSVAFATVLTSLIQTRFIFSLHSLAPQMSRLRAAGTVGRIKEGCLDGGLGVLRAVLLIIVASPLLLEYLRSSPERLRLPLQYGVSSEAGAPALSALVWGTAIRTGYALTALAVLGYGLCRWRYLRQYRMSLQELRDEYKESEGDPYMKSARKHEHEALLLSEIRERVKRAKVIVVRRNVAD